MGLCAEDLTCQTAQCGVQQTPQPLQQGGMTQLGIDVWSEKAREATSASNWALKQPKFI